MSRLAVHLMHRRTTRLTDGWVTRRPPTTHAPHQRGARSNNSLPCGTLQFCICCLNTCQRTHPVTIYLHSHLRYKKGSCAAALFLTLREAHFLNLLFPYGHCLGFFGRILPNEYSVGKHDNMNLLTTRCW